MDWKKFEKAIEMLKKLRAMGFKPATYQIEPPFGGGPLSSKEAMQKVIDDGFEDYNSKRRRAEQSRLLKDSANSYNKPHPY
jgi:pentatricopeptide repeat protein